VCSGFPSGTATNEEAEAFSFFIESRKCFGLLGFLLLAGCATSSGSPVANIPQSDIAAAYIPLHRGGLLSHAEGAGVAIAPGIAVTNAHNRNLVAPERVIGEARDYDLLFFRDARSAPRMAAEPHIGETVTAYGQGRDGELRLAHGVVRAVRDCPGCTVPAYFIFAGDAGPGFSGGPVLNPAGQLVGIVFGYKEEAPERVIYAYPMSRVRSVLSALSGEAK
jgi:S1-C subfamily serine protease